MAQRSHEGVPLSPDAIAFVRSRDSFYLASASPEGEPYVQHRGGAPGFLVPLDAHTLGFADYAGNRKYDSLGHVLANPRAMLFLMDYPARRRLKLWTDVRVVTGPVPPELHPLLATAHGERVERLFVLGLRAWEWNCPKHILPRYTAREWLTDRPALRLVHLEITDAEGYAAYRRAMEPLLRAHGGRFELDVEGTFHPCHTPFVPNRTIVIRFPSRRAATAFFEDPDYVRARTTWFDPSVRRSVATWLAEDEDRVR